MGRSSGYTVEEEKIFVTENTDGTTGVTLNDKGKWYNTQLKKARGFDVLMWALGIIAVIVVTALVAGYFRGRQVRKQAELKAAASRLPPALAPRNTTEIAGAAARNDNTRQDSI